MNRELEESLLQIRDLVAVWTPESGVHAVVEEMRQVLARMVQTLDGDMAEWAQEEKKKLDEKFAQLEGLKLGPELGESSKRIEDGVAAIPSQLEAMVTELQSLAKRCDLHDLSQKIDDRSNGLGEAVDKIEAAMERHASSVEQAIASSETQLRMAISQSSQHAVNRLLGAAPTLDDMGQRTREVVNSIMANYMRSMVEVLDIGAGLFQAGMRNDFVRIASWLAHKFEREGSLTVTSISQDLRRISATLQAVGAEADARLDTVSEKQDAIGTNINGLQETCTSIHQGVEGLPQSIEALDRRVSELQNSSTEALEAWRTDRGSNATSNDRAAELFIEETRKHTDRLGQLERELAISETKRQEAEKSAEAVPQLQAELDRQKTLISDLSTQVDTLKRKNLALDEKVYDLEWVGDDDDDMGKRLEDAENRARESEKLVSDLSKKLEDAENKARESEKTASDMGKQLEDAENRARESEQSASDSKRDQEVTQDLYNEAISNVDRLRVIVREREAAAYQLQGENTVLKDTNQATIKQIIGVFKIGEAVGKATGDVVGEYQRYEQTISALKESNLSKDEMLGRVLKQGQECQDKMESLCGAVLSQEEDMKENLESKHALMDEVFEAKRQFDEQIAEKDRALREVRSHNASLQSMMLSKDKAIADLESKLVEASSTLDDNQAIIRKKDEALREALDERKSEDSRKRRRAESAKPLAEKRPCFASYLDQLASRAARFPVVDDDEFDMGTITFVAATLSTDGVFMKVRDFLQDGTLEKWFCYREVTENGHLAESLREVDGVRCRKHQYGCTLAVMVTDVDSVRSLRFQRNPCN